MIVPVNNVGEHGVIVDRQPHELPTNAWSFAQNMRFKDGFAEKFLGHSPQFGTPTIAPHWLLPVATPTSYLWLYAGLAKVYTYDGVHTNITRQTAAVDVDYAATANLNWTGGVLGGIAIINNGVDDPQMWNPASPGTKLILLSNWPANTKARSLRTFRQYLVALDVTKAGVRFPQMVKWSHPAAAGTVPSSWDPTDTTKDAGEYELKDTGDFCLDSFPLRDVNIIYKENTTHLMQFIGGLLIFRFAKVLNAAGALSRRCAVEYIAGRHAVFGDGDIYTHDGLNAQSLVTARLRRRIFNSIDSSFFQRSFLAFNPFARELWFCFPETGNSFPNLAAVWNHESNAWGFRELPLTAHMEPGVIDPGAASDQWNVAVGSWASETQVWDQRLYNPSQRSVLMAQPGGPTLFTADVSAQFNSVNMTVILERQGLALPMRPEGPPDLELVKQFTRLWPRITGTLGGVVQVHVGAQMVVGQAPVYQAPQDFVIGTTQSVTMLSTGRLLALKFTSSTTLDWRMHGYEVEVSRRGNA